MVSKIPQNFLRYVLWADALSCLACGLLQVTLTGSLDQRFGLPLPLYVGSGVFLILYSVAVAYLATRPNVPSAIVWLLIVGNVAWGVGAVGILVGADMSVTVLGKAYIIAQALTVLVLAQLQYLCVRPGQPNRRASARQQSNE